MTKTTLGIKDTQELGKIPVAVVYLPGKRETRHASISAMIPVLLVKPSLSTVERIAKL